MSKDAIEFVVLKQEAQPDESITIELWGDKDANSLKSLIRSNRPRIMDVDFVFIGLHKVVPDEIINRVVQSDEKSYWENYMKQYAESLKKGIALTQENKSIKYMNYKNNDFSCSSAKESLLTAVELLGSNDVIGIILNRLPKESK